MLHQQGTGSWILDTSEWQGWMSKRYRLLWLHGIPGAGKTILASYLYKKLPEHLSTYYYCYFGHNQDETRAFLGWIISQICQKQDILPDSLVKMHAKSRYDQTEDEPFLKVLEDSLNGVEEMNIILDAVDESMVPRDRFLNILRILSTDVRFKKIQLLVTSREYYDIELVLKPISIPVRMKPDSDIALYVDNELRTNRWYSKWPTSLRDEVTITLTTKAEGM
jgi:hypothetical protein